MGQGRPSKLDEIFQEIFHIRGSHTYLMRHIKVDHLYFFCIFIRGCHMDHGVHS